ncbi:MAG: DSD1 family PLP-dependent enzyme [Pseudomonadota bacterium]
MGHAEIRELEVGYDVPAAVGMPVSDVATPCLIVDLDALERNIAKMGTLAADMGVRHRVHGKMHKSADIALLQQRLGGACGVCCQKVSEAEAFVRGGIADVMVTNQVTDPPKIDRLARLPLRGATISVCVDDPANVAALSEAAVRHGTVLDCLVEIDCGQRRCGVVGIPDVIEIARQIDAVPGLEFAGLQSYHGSAQHFATFAERQVAIEAVIAQTRETVDALAAAGLPCKSVTGAGTGTFEFEGRSGLYTELQCGSYAFMDADYGRLTDADGARLDRGQWENALFILASIMSVAGEGRAVCDAGLKVQSVDSGLPVIHGREDVEYTGCSDEHGVIRDPGNVLKLNDRLRLIPGHCDPTCNIHDWYVGLRGDVVECVWPVSARGKAW